MGHSEGRQTSGHARNFSEPLPDKNGIQPRNFTEPLPERTDFFKGRCKLWSRQKPMTLVVGAHCKNGSKDCILFLSDTQLTDSSLWTDYGTKIYTVPEMSRAPGMIGLAGFYGTFDVVRGLFKDNFVEMKDGIGIPQIAEKDDCTVLENVAIGSMLGESTKKRSVKKSIAAIWFMACLP